MLEIWQLMYFITILSGPPLDTSGKAIKYPYEVVDFEPPAEWLGCYKQKQIVVPVRQKYYADRGIKATVTATCRRIVWPVLR